MTNEITVETKANPDNMLDPTQSFRLVKETFDKVTEVASVDAVYAEPIRNGDVIVVPSAEVLGMVGFGAGTGGGKDEKNNRGGGGGAGGWSRVFSRPVAAVVITPDNVRVEPIVDVTKVALAAFTAAGFMLAMIARMSARRMPRE
ncbi:MAG: hypothetical protein HZB51_12435 [Chloroflexi bacterium]|nr:hypothetical protein [Chloroflexota bacterium]